MAAPPISRSSLGMLVPPTSTYLLFSSSCSSHSSRAAPASAALAAIRLSKALLKLGDLGFQARHMAAPALAAIATARSRRHGVGRGPLR